MRVENVVVSVVCGAAVLLAVWIAWGGRHLALVADRSADVVATAPPSARAAARDALRSVAGVLTAGLVAGALVAGLGGRLLMRVLAATSGDDAQGRLTEAEETVGEITFDGTLGFVIFVGLLVPAGASLVYLVLRRFLPDRAWIAGLVFGLLLLATFGVDDPLASDNVDFRILRPLPLAVGLVVATALLFGVTFTALAARFDRSRLVTGRRAGPRPTDLGLIALVLPFYLVPAAVYVAVRTVARGRLGVLLERPTVQRAGRAIVAIAAIVAAVVVVRTSTEIL
jgi:hypothetical protein